MMTQKYNQGQGQRVLATCGISTSSSDESEPLSVNIHGHID